jgi:hypothetical protein
MSSSASEIVFQIDNNSNMIAGKDHKVLVQIKSSGNAVEKNPCIFKFLPKIASISPTIGKCCFVFV